MSSPKMFPIVPTTQYPIIFTQSWTCIMYKGGPKRSTSILLFWRSPNWKLYGTIIPSLHSIHWNSINQFHMCLKTKQDWHIKPFMSNRTCPWWLEDTKYPITTSIVEALVCKEPCMVLYRVWFMLWEKN